MKTKTKHKYVVTRLGEVLFAADSPGEITGWLNEEATWVPCNFEKLGKFEHAKYDGVRLSVWRLTARGYEIGHDLRRLVSRPYKPSQGNNLGPVSPPEYTRDFVSPRDMTTVGIYECIHGG